MNIPPDVNDIPVDRQKTVAEARSILDAVLTQNQQDKTKQMASELEGEAKTVFTQRLSARLSTILQQQGYNTVSQDTFTEMLNQLDLC